MVLPLVGVRLWGRRDDGVSLVLAEVCARVGAEVTEARLIKFTNNAAFALPSSGLVVRISGSSPVAHRARTVVAVARWLAEHEMPTIRLATTLPQPLDIDGHAVTFWKLVPDTGPQPTGHDLGRILRRFHALPDTSADLPAWNTLGMIRVRIGAADFLAPDERVYLTKTADAIASDLDDVDYVVRVRRLPETTRSPTRLQRPPHALDRYQVACPTAPPLRHPPSGRSRRSVGALPLTAPHSVCRLADRCDLIPQEA